MLRNKVALSVETAAAVDCKYFLLVALLLKTDAVIVALLSKLRMLWLVVVEIVLIVVGMTSAASLRNPNAAEDVMLSAAVDGDGRCR